MIVCHCHHTVLSNENWTIHLIHTTVKCPISDMQIGMHDKLCFYLSRERDMVLSAHHRYVREYNTPE